MTYDNIELTEKYKGKCWEDEEVVFKCIKVEKLQVLGGMKGMYCGDGMYGVFVRKHIKPHEPLSYRSYLLFKDVEASYKECSRIVFDKAVMHAHDM